MSGNKTSEASPTPTEARLDETAGDIAKIAPVVRSAIDKTLANEITLQQAESITRSADVLLGLWELEADLLRMRGARKVKRR
jgi:hypothetical protein